MTPAAYAQDAAGLAKTISDGVRCLEDRITDDLSDVLARVGENDQVIVHDALTLLGADPAICEPLRNAARAVMAARTNAVADDEVNVEIAARAVVDATLADAERRANSLKFEVGPPPLNLSQGRTGGS